MASRKPRILFCSYHSYIDPSSGAAQSTRDLLELLTGHGWPCAALTGPQVDLGEATSFEALLRAESPSIQVRPGTVGNVSACLYHCMVGGVPYHGFVPTGYQRSKPTDQEEGRAFLGLFDLVAQRFQPDILLTYGGQDLAFALIHRAKKRGLKVVFALHNIDYAGRDLFREVDAVFVPSEFARDHYQRTLGITAAVLPGPWNLERIVCPEVQGRYVTFVNPQPYKGAFWFARIAQELNRLDPAIPLLVVEGRGKVDWFARCEVDLRGLSNVSRMPNTSDPRQFYQISRLLLMPSLCHEALGRVAVEASLNGIPVLASRRGGLPEALGGAGVLIDMPESFPPSCQKTPTAEDVAPWVKEIQRLWHDPALYVSKSIRSREAAQVWLPDRLLPRFEEFFQRVVATG